jgi:hypothetical protein
MNRRTFVGLAFVFTLPLSACTASDGPVDPVWGKQPCAHCAMLVTEARFAGQALEKTGARHYFDDLGCLALWMEGKQLAGSWAYEAARRAGSTPRRELPRWREDPDGLRLRGRRRRRRAPLAGGP